MEQPNTFSAHASLSRSMATACASNSHAVCQVVMQVLTRNSEFQAIKHIEWTSQERQYARQQVMDTELTYAQILKEGQKAGILDEQRTEVGTGISSVHHLRHGIPEEFT